MIRAILDSRSPIVGGLHVDWDGRGGVWVSPFGWPASVHPGHPVWRITVDRTGSPDSLGVPPASAFNSSMSSMQEATESLPYQRSSMAADAR